MFVCGPGVHVCGPGEFVCGPGVCVCGPGVFVCGPGVRVSMIRCLFVNSRASRLKQEQRMGADALLPFSLHHSLTLGQSCALIT